MILFFINIYIIVSWTDHNHKLVFHFVFMSNTSGICTMIVEGDFELYDLV